MIARKRVPQVLALLAFSAVALVPPAVARQWKPDARGAALDYTQVLHSKGAGQVVVVWWVVPETFAGAPNAQPIQDVLSRYVVLGIVDARPTPNVQMNFATVADLKVSDATGRTLSPLAGNVIPPEAAQATTNLQGMARQNLGPIGQGMRFFVYEGSTIHSCQPGKMSVPYGGETYVYDTPIPGCPGR